MTPTAFYSRFHLLIAMSMLDLTQLEKIIDDTPPLPNHWGGRCFGCVPANPQGLHLQFWRAGDFCASRFRVPAELCGFDGIAHGGIVASVLDEAGAWVIVTQLDHLGMTQDATIYYHHPVPTCIDLMVIAQIISHNDTRVVTRAEIRGRNNALLAETASHWILPPLGVLAHVTHMDVHVIQIMLERFLAPIRETKLTPLPFLPNK